MNLNRVEAFKRFEGNIKLLPILEEVTESFTNEKKPRISLTQLLEDFDHLKRSFLPAEEYFETLDEPLKSNLKRRLNNSQMLNRIHDICNDQDIISILTEEYLCMHSFDSWTDDQRKSHLEGIHERYKQTYAQHADKIAEYRARLGLGNPISEFKPY